MFTTGFEKTSGIADKAKGLWDTAKKAISGFKPSMAPSATAIKSPKPATPSWVRSGVTSGKIKYIDVKE